MPIERINIKGEPYKLQLAAVMERHSDGSPKLLRVLKAEEEVKLSENSSENWFIFFYTKASNIDNPPKENVDG